MNKSNERSQVDKKSRKKLAAAVCWQKKEEKVRGKINNNQRATCARGRLNLSSVKSVSKRVSVYVCFCRQRRRRRLNLYRFRQSALGVIRRDIAQRKQKPRGRSRRKVLVEGG